MIKQNNVLQFEKFSSFANLIHGFSTNFFGSLRPRHDVENKSLQKFTDALGINPHHVVRTDQVHGNKVYFATKKDYGQTIDKTDGLLTSEKDLFLGIITADCLPILFYDSQKNYVGSVHAGWRGLHNEIIAVAVLDLIKKGSNPKNIIVGIGPSIRVCCYEVSEEFIKNFKEKFNDVEKYIDKRGGKVFFNMQLFATGQLQSAGILPKNIEDADYCTFDQKDLYSCRRDKGDFGEIMGIIGTI